MWAKILRHIDGKVQHQFDWSKREPSKLKNNKNKEKNKNLNFFYIEMGEKVREGSFSLRKVLVQCLPFQLDSVLVLIDKVNL